MKVESYKVRGQTKYRFRAYVGTDPATGKPVRVKQSGFDSKKEAQLACAELVAKNQPSKAKEMTYRQAYDLWMNTYRLTVKDSTLRHTRQIFRDHILPVFGRLKLRDITPIQCQAFANDQALAAVNASERVAYMAKVFDFAVRNEVIDKNPAALIQRPKKHSPARTQRPADMNYYTKEELKEFLSLCQKRLPHMWYVFFRVLAYTGMRRGEALALTWNDIDPAESSITISKTVTRNADGTYVSDTPKTDRSNRTIIIDGETLQLIMSLVANKKKSEFVFPNTKGSFCSTSLPAKMLHKAVDGSDLKYISPHGLRHTHCSLLFSAGVSIPEVQDRLGHSDVKTTLDVYNHVYKQDKQHALNQFEEFMK